MKNNFSDINQIWNLIVNKVRELDINDEKKVDAFLPQLRPVAISENFLMLTTANSFIKSWVEGRGNILILIKEALKQLYGTDFMVQIEIDSTSTESNSNVSPVPIINNNSTISNNTPITHSEPISNESINNSFIAANLLTQKNIQDTDPMNVFSNDINNELQVEDNEAFNLNLAELLTFENFVIGNSNNIAFQMAKSVAKNPGKPNLNPLFIYGRSGVGKTHLLHAIKNYIRFTNPKIKVVYVDAAEFVNEFTEAATAHDVDKSSFHNFRKKYEEAYVLLIDDLQVLQNKTQTLNIFFNIFNKITNMGRQIVISADRAPKNIDVDERYQSRFNKGMSCEITSPEIEVKLGIIKSYIEDFKKDNPDVEQYLSNDINNYIAQNSSSNIRELKSAITKILYEIEFNKETLSVDDAKIILEEHFSKNIKKRVTTEKIQSTVAEFFNVSVTDIVGKKKDREIAYARQVSMFLCNKFLDTTVSAIGKSFNRDHSTVLYSIKTIQKKLNTNRELNEEIEVLSNKILDKY